MPRPKRRRKLVVNEEKKEEEEEINGFEDMTAMEGSPARKRSKLLASSPRRFFFFVDVLEAIFFLQWGRKNKLCQCSFETCAIQILCYLTEQEIVDFFNFETMFSHLSFFSQESCHNTREPCLRKKWNLSSKYSSQSWCLIIVCHGKWIKRKDLRLPVSWSPNEEFLRMPIAWRIKHP